MKRYSNHTITLLIFCALIYSCARISTPTGGPQDKEIPEVLGYSIPNKSIKVASDTKEIEITFNEYIKLTDATNQIVISPPMEMTPTFSPLGFPRKAITIKFNEKLKENTTYSINFGTSIEDNNEGNKLSNFTYVFSTGKTIDSLILSGKIQDVKSIEYDDKAFVGLYKVDTSYNDSIIFKQKPYYVTRPDSLGVFKFNHLHEGNYVVMGLSDGNRNLKYDPIIDKLAFKKDTIQLPSNDKINLTLFAERSPFSVKTPSYDNWGKVIFEFLGNPENIKVKNRDISYKKELQLKSTSKDSLIYWFKPLEKDTLKENKKDTMSFLVFDRDKIIDTLTFNKKTYFRPEKIQLKNKQVSNDFAIPEFTSKTPLTKFNKNLIKLLDKDSVAIDFKIVHNSNDLHSFKIDFKKKFEQNYHLTFLPESVQDFFNETIDTLQYSFKTSKEQDYANLEVKIENPPKSKFWLQLISDKNVKRSVYTDQSTINFKSVKPGTYTLRMIVDQNNNEVWDTGNYWSNRQPEPYLFNFDEILLNAYWDVKKTWDITKTPIIKIKKLDKKANDKNGKPEQPQPKK